MELVLDVSGLNRRAKKNGVKSRRFVIRDRSAHGSEYELSDKPVQVSDVHAHLLIAENPTLVKEAGGKGKK